MRTDYAKVPPPSDDKRWRVVGATMRRMGYQPYALIETLHSVQESFGFLDEDALRYISTVLDVPLSRVYGTATFYQFFTLKPKGAYHTCVICMGTSCHIKGGATLLASIEQTFNVKAGNKTADGKMYLQTARCLGSCGMAPAVVFDGEMMGKADRSRVLKHIKEWLATD